MAKHSLRRRLGIAVGLALLCLGGRAFAQDPLPSADDKTGNYFVDTRADQTIVPVARIVYATMKGHDVAVLELQARYADLVDQPGLFMKARIARPSWFGTLTTP